MKPRYADLLESSLFIKGMWLRFYLHAIESINKVVKEYLYISYTTLQYRYIIWHQNLLMTLSATWNKHERMNGPLKSWFIDVFTFYSNDIELLSGLRKIQSWEN